MARAEIRIVEWGQNFTVQLKLLNTRSQMICARATDDNVTTRLKHFNACSVSAQKSRIDAVNMWKIRTELRVLLCETSQGRAGPANQALS